MGNAAPPTTKIDLTSLIFARCFGNSGAVSNMYNMVGTPAP